MMTDQAQLSRALDALDQAFLAISGLKGADAFNALVPQLEHLLCAVGNTAFVIERPFGQETMVHQLEGINEAARTLVRVAGSTIEVAVSLLEETT